MTSPTPALGKENDISVAELAVAEALIVLLLCGLMKAYSAGEDVGGANEYKRDDSKK